MIITFFQFFIDKLTISLHLSFGATHISSVSSCKIEKNIYYDSHRIRLNIHYRIGMQKL